MIFFMFYDFIFIYMLYHAAAITVNTSKDFLNYADTSVIGETRCYDQILLLKFYISISSFPAVKMLPFARKLTPDGWKYTQNSQRSHEVVDRGDAAWRQE